MNTCIGKWRFQDVALRLEIIYETLEASTGGPCRTIDAWSPSPVTAGELPFTVQTLARSCSPKAEKDEKTLCSVAYTSQPASHQLGAKAEEYFVDLNNVNPQLSCRLFCR